MYADNIKKYMFVLVWFCMPYFIQSQEPMAMGGELITEWNKKVFEIAIEEDGLLTLKGVRTAAMLHSAMHDALNAIIPKYSPYCFDSEVTDADPWAAVAQAGYEVAFDQYPDYKKPWSALLTKQLGRVYDKKAMKKGIRLGKKAAAEILNKRGNDHHNREAEYTWHPMAPGV